MSDPQGELRYRIEYDDYAGLSWLEQWDTPEKYAGNEILVDGEPLSFEDYILYYGNPNRHVKFVLLTEERCPCCGEWRIVDSVCGIDFMDDSKDCPAPGTYALEELSGYMLELAKEFQ